MTTEDLVETFIQTGFRCYKKVYKDKPLYACLSRHQEIEIEGYTFSFWREFVCYKMMKYIKSIIPEANLELFLDGNQSTIQMEITEAEQRKLNSALFVFEKKHGMI